jgi:hypothetical protein
MAFFDLVGGLDLRSLDIRQELFYLTAQATGVV